MFVIRTNGLTSTIDFVLTDGVPDDSGNLPAVLTGRVSMANDKVVALRDMLVSHTAAWEAVENDA